MNLTQAHIAVVAIVVVCTTILGYVHSLESGDITNVYIACLGSLTGHAIGYAAGQVNKDP